MARTKQDEVQLPLVAINQGTKQHLLKAIYFLIELRRKDCVSQDERERERYRGEKKDRVGKNDREVLIKDRAYSLWLSYTITTLIISEIHI